MTRSSASDECRVSLDQGLAERWYAIRGRLGPGEQVTPDTAPLDGDAVVSRFFVGRLPVLRRVMVVRDEETAVEFVFSERVRMTSRALEIEASGNRRDDCTLVNAEELGDSEGANAAHFRCSSTFPSTGFGLRGDDTLRGAYGDDPVVLAGGGSLTGATSGVDVLSVTSLRSSDRSPFATDAEEETALPELTVLVPTFGLLDRHAL